MMRATERFDQGLQKVLLILVIVVLLLGNSAMSDSVAVRSSNGSYSNNMVLNVYINDAGRALVTGYVDSIDGLYFLNASQYQYDKDSKQLYALTNSLTCKSGDDWVARMQFHGDCGEYHSIFYMPSSVAISNINSTQGLEYLVSASNESFVVDLHGYDIKNPDVTINYRVPLSGAATASGGERRSYLLPGLAILGLCIVSASAVVWVRHGRKPAQPAVLSNGAVSNLDDSSSHDSEGDQAKAVAEASAANLPSTPDPGPENLPKEYEGSDAQATYEELEQDDIQPAEPEDGPLTDDGDMEPCPPQLSAPVSSSIEITSEMAAVMETLTAREKAVMTALIGRSGKMTQADIRYETRIPKSSLTGIILSLERRKLVIKKEWGRTNIIELSEWFLSKRERS